MATPKSRPVGGTEYGLWRAVPGGTGIAVLALLVSKAPDILRLQNAIDKLQNLHPILKSRLILHSNTVSFNTSPAPFVQIKSHSTLECLSSPENHSNISPFHLVLEHELNQNTWSSSCSNTADMLFFASIYALPNTKWVVVLRLHLSAFDRTTAASLLRELLVLMGEGEEGEETHKEMAMSLGIEDLIPRGKAKKKALWTRGVDMLSYSVSSLSLTNLKFQDPRSPRSSQVVRLQINQSETHRILAGCKSRGIKLSGALVAAGLIAAYASKRRADNQGKKYGVTTLVDCRSILDPPLSSHHFGFYHAAILNTHVMKGGEKLWELAQKMYMAFANSKKCNKHLSDMADLNFLMCKAIENPGLTPASSLRVSFMSVFEDPVIINDHDHDQPATDQLGLEDYMWCASVHGVGPSIAIFDTIRDGCLDCACVYPAPLHSREQIQELVDTMKAVLVDGGNHVQETYMHHASCMADGSVGS
ncbi:uncharacterized protein LOC132192235 [Corylus avellana]|uniref:uncharacterized protein LOC132192235 n=1 Tax=Corylus avellana TaxID=13451 RepID=UPI00286B9DC1|nr:uncharacterized protein LOC132192235 [Corylus avellana]